MKFNWLRFDDMKASTAISLLTLRNRVFGEAGLYQAQEVDDIDKYCDHLCVSNHLNQVVGCLRIYQLKHSVDINAFQIGRLCVDEYYRNQKIAKKMLGMAIVRGMGQGLEATFETYSPVYLSEFYKSLGFDVRGDPYTEDDIPLIRMKLSQPSILEIQQEPTEVHKRKVRVS